MADKDVVRLQVETEFGEVEGLDKIEKKLKQSLKKAVESGVSRGFSDSEERITRFKYGDKAVIGSYRQTKKGTIKPTGMYFPADASEEARLYGSKTKLNFEGKLTDIRKKRFKEQQKEIASQKKKNKNKTDVSDKKDRPRITGMQKLLNTFKRVGFYRIARRIFSFIEQGFAKGMNSLVQFDEQANKTMSGLATAWEKINASIALVTEPLLESILPMITGISDSFTDFANGISMASRSMKGFSDYTKISDDYMKDLQNTGKQLSFDKFTSLNMEDGPFETAKITDEDQERLAKYTNMLNNIKEVFAGIKSVLEPVGKFVKKIIEWVIENPDSILNAIMLITALLAASKIKALFSPIVFMTFAIYEVVKNVKDLIDNWNSKSLADKIKSIIKIALYGVGALLIALSPLISFLATPAVGTVFKIAGITAIGATAILDGIGVFANGGMVDTGSLFIAGESGAELVTTMPSGQTGVTNVAQFKQAMLEALYEWGGGFGDGGSVVLNLDGAEVARSRRFTEEMNRRNAGLNLR